MRSVPLTPGRVREQLVYRTERLSRTSIETHVGISNGIFDLALRSHKTPHIDDWMVRVLR
ncbi:MAG: hypothetical protein PHH87_10995 [Desulfuromonas sp.]|nr:hypothetical protein [Desulfuromonas sp.]